MACIPETDPPTVEQLDAEEQGRRGQKAYKHFLEATSGGTGIHQVLVYDLHSLYCVAMDWSEKKLWFSSGHTSA